jgi:hypothetical protein
MLVNLHLTVLSPHASVKHLVEEDVAIITFDGHLKEILLHLSVVILFFVEP